MSPRTSKRSGVLELAVLGLLHEQPRCTATSCASGSTPCSDLPRVLLRLALPLPQARSSAAGWIVEDAGRRVAAGPRPLGPAGEDRLPAHRRGQGALRRAARRRRPGRLGGRALRRPLRLLRAHRRPMSGCASWRAAAAAGGAPGELRASLGPHPGAPRQLHPRAPAARAGVRRARGPLARTSSSSRAQRRQSTRPPSSTPARQHRRARLRHSPGPGNRPTARG